jgi:hypothetical protein
MKDDDSFGFGRMVPGFDFLQNLAKGATQAMPQMPSLSNWVAPTLSVEELEKRISELKAVHFWLEQNGKALGATIQALEVQKMTLATLKTMNFSMGDLANSLRLKTASGLQKAAEAAGDTADKVAGAADKVAGAAKTAKGAAAAKAETRGKSKAGNGQAPGAVDPLQWWGALTQQFQEIAANAMKDVAQKTAVDTARNMTTGAVKEAVKAATGMAKAATRKAPARRKPAARKTKAA